ncbi:MAG TPA: hypothetical protein VF519_07965 [Mycobacteriales bacterium]|jgi:hypothetical protein
MKRVLLAVVVAAVAAAFAPSASAELCVYGRTPYPIACVPPFNG